MEESINCFDGSIVDYVWHSRPRPFSLNVGLLDGVYKYPYEIIASYHISEAMLTDSAFFDKENMRVHVQLLDGHGVPVIAQWRNVKNISKISGRLYLKESS